MIPRKYIIMLTYLLVLPLYSTDNIGWWQQIKPYMTRILGLSSGGVVGAVLAPRLQQNRYIGALCGAGLGLSSTYLLNWLYKQYRDRIRQTESTVHKDNIVRTFKMITKKENYNKKLTDMIQRHNPEAKIIFEGLYDNAPDTILRDGEMALHIAIQYNNSDFVYWFIDQYSKDINKLLLLTHPSTSTSHYSSTPIFTALSHMQEWNKRVTSYDDKFQLFTHDPLYKRILYIIAHKDEYQWDEGKKQIIDAIYQIDATKLNPLIEDLLKQEQEQAQVKS